MAAKKTKTTIRKTQIINAALEIIDKGGFNSLTISTIAKKVGIVESNIYRHFRNKDALIKALILGIDYSLEKVVKEEINKKESPLKCLQNIFFAHIDFLKRHKGILKILFLDESISNSKESIKKTKNSAVKKYLTEIKNILWKGINERLLDKRLDIDAAATVFWGVIQSTVLQWIIFGDYFAPHKLRCKRAWQIYLKGILSR